ncbi:MAG TPA: DUF6734 family protein [Cytophagales bacterium]
MKIVQSYWSKPALAGRQTVQNRSSGGWLEQKYHYMGWALSCLQFRKFYAHLELVTDQWGRHVFIDRLRLPYTHVREELDSLNPYHPDLWALGKLRAYQLQQEPFLHVDGDVIIWRPFAAELVLAPLVAQNEDVGFSFYEESLAEIAQHFSYIPPVVKRDRTVKPLRSVNAGILGGTDTAFFKRYTDEAFRFVDRNLAHLSQVTPGLFNAVYEQYLFSCLAREAGQPVAFYQTDRLYSYGDFERYFDASATTGLLHPIGLAKKKPSLNQEIEFRLRKDYPEYYFRILDLLKADAI